MIPNPLAHCANIPKGHTFGVENIPLDTAILASYTLLAH